MTPPPAPTMAGEPELLSHEAPARNPWTNGRAERKNRIIKDATVKTYHYDDLESLKPHVTAFVTAISLRRSVWMGGS